VADALSHVSEGQSHETPEMACAAVLKSLPLVYSSMEEHQADDQFCKDLRQKITTDQAAVDNFQIHKGLVCFFLKRAKRCRWVVPTTLRPMLLKYFHDSALAGHLGAFITFHKIVANFWWPKMRTEIFQYVRRCDLCQWAKPAQNTRVGLHTAEPPSQPMEKLFVVFVGPLTLTKRGNSAILVVLDGFSKFVVFYPVRSVLAGCR